MPSSISSFKRPGVSGPWLKTWLCAAVLCLGMLGGMEVFWRSHGHVPSISDNPGRWAVERYRLQGRDGRTVALLGASRMQADISLDTLKQMFPDYEIVQLAVAACRPIASLCDLANDEGFSGIVLCAVKAPDFEPYVRDQQKSYVDFYRKNSTLNTRLNSRIGTMLQSNMVILDPYLKPLSALKGLLLTKKLPGRRVFVMRADRSGRADYSGTDARAQGLQIVEENRLVSAAHPAPAVDDWLKQTAEIAPLVAKLKSRGGKVVFLRFPTTGEHWAFDESTYPKSLYWDRLASVTGAETIHFKDVPSLATFDCPDMSHIDCRNAPAFTRALAEELIRRGILSRHADAP